MERASHLKARQIKAARALLDWSQEDLAHASSLSIATIRKLELGHISPRGKTTNFIRHALEDAGLEFLDPDGVRHRPEEIKIYHGQEGAIDFYDCIYQSAKKGGVFVIVSPDAARIFTDVLGKEFHAMHIKRMAEIKENFFMKCIIMDEKSSLPGPVYCEYRWISRHYVDSVPFYVYEDKYAIFIYGTDPSSFKITVIQSRAVADAFRDQFHSMWDKATPLNKVDRKSEETKKRTNR